MEKVEALTVKHRTQTRLAQLPDMIKEYAQWLEKTKKPQTVLEYVKDIGLFSDYLKERQREEKEPFDESTFRELKRDDIEEFLFSYLSKHEKVYKRLNGKEVQQTFQNKEKSQRRKLSSLRSFSKYLFMEAKFLQEDITHGIEIGSVEARTLPYLKKTTQTAILDAMEVYSEDEFQKVRNQFMTFLFLKVGIKTGELLALDIKDVKVHEKKLRIEREGQEEPEMLDISKVPGGIIHKYLELRAERKIPIGWHQDALFVSIRNKRLNRRTIHYIFQRYERFVELDQRLTPQLLRNTFVMETPLKNESDLAVSKQLGVKDMYAMKRTYPIIKQKRQTKKNVT